MPKIGDRVTFIGAPAGGVLSGTYPNPQFAEPLATAADVGTKADIGHVHNASSLTSGVLSIDRIPTSTSSVATAVPRADDPRLSAPRPWNRYSTASTATAGQVPTWNGSTFVPATPPSAQAPPDATPTQKGVIQLAGDLSGTSASPKVVIRGPLGGHLAAPANVGSITLNASLGNSFHISATGNVSINPPSNPTDGQRIILEVFAAGGAARAITIAASVAVVSSVNRSISAAAGKIVFIELLYSARPAKWIVTFTAIEA